MREREFNDVRSVARWPVWVASWIVPSGVRREWKRLRLNELGQYGAFLRERGEGVLSRRRKLLIFALGAFPDALSLRFTDSSPGERFRRWARSPSFVFAAIGLALLVLTLGSDFFWAPRMLYGRLPLPNEDRLVSCFQVHFLSVSFGVQSRYIGPWKNESRTLAGVEAYQAAAFRAGLPGGPERIVDGARITPGLFPLLGVASGAGRLFRPEDSGPDPPLVISFEFWREHFGKSPFVPGRGLRIDGRERPIVGVLPAGFWFRAPAIQIWTLLPDLGRPDPSLRLVNAVGLLAPSATPGQAREELQTIAWRSSRFRGGAFRVVPLATSLRPTLQFPLLSLFAGSLLALGAALVQFGRAWRQPVERRFASLRYWAFFPLKVAAVLGVSLATAAELSARNALAFQPSKLILGLVIDWASILATLLILRWAILDQSQRCPVCLRRLATPVTSGSWSSSLLEPVSTEMLCDQGHGALRLGETHTTLGEIRRWVDIEDSWRELLASEDKTK